MKVCFRCKQEKKLTELYRNCRKVDGRCPTCKVCMRDYESRRPSRNTYREDPEGQKRRVRRYQARRKYRVPEKLLDEVLHRAEHGTCEICGKAAPVDAYHKRHHIDHDHKTGEYRGILCKDCNRMLGSARDNPEILRRAVAYLEERAGRVY